MLRCSTIEERLSAYIDGLLGEDAAALVDSHLGECDACADLREHMLGVVDWARSFPSHPAPTRMLSTILARTGPLIQHRDDAARGQEPLCPVIEEQLSEYIEGLLPSHRDSSVAAHLENCDSCRDLHENMVAAIGWARTAEPRVAPGFLVSRILAGTLGGVGPTGACARIREDLADYVDGLAARDNRASVRAYQSREVLEHLDHCPGCQKVRDDMFNVVDWAARFPTHPAPRWLAARIVANTGPRRTDPAMRQRETWLDTLTAIGGWILEPRTAMAVFTSVLVLGWMSSVAGVEAATLTSPTAMYYSVEALADDVYDRSVRFYYDVPQTLVDQFQARLDRLQERSR